MVTCHQICIRNFDALENIELFIESKFISNLFNSLTNNYLFKVITKVYINISKRLSKELWKITFGEHLKIYITTWETE
jgi:hypothetical protein